LANIRTTLKELPILGNFLQKAYRLFAARSCDSTPFSNSANYWETRYSHGGNSGAGSYNRLAEFKAQVLNDFVRTNSISTVIEFGCGDGNQLTLARYPTYLGLDVSTAAINLCRGRFKDDNTKSFNNMTGYRGQKAELALSLDVIYHLVEDDVFEKYMTLLFSSAERFVAIYSSNFDSSGRDTGPHVRHREFASWVGKSAPDWHLLEHIPNRYPHNGNDQQGSMADFYLYQKLNLSDPIGA
jgi:hypothetical protein